MIIHRPGKNNFVADALSRRPYPEEQENITITIPPINSICLTKSSDEENDIEKVCVQVNLFYDPSETDIVVLEEDHLQPVLDDRKSLAQLQRECPDFKDIIRYVEKQDLPQDTSKHNSIVAESKHYSIVNGILTHLFQRRCSRQPEEMRYITQIALPKVLRLDAL